MFLYDVSIHFRETEKQCQHWETYCVGADCVDNARYNAIIRVVYEINSEYAKTIDCVRVYRYGTDELLKEYDI